MIFSQLPAAFKKAWITLVVAWLSVVGAVQLFYDKTSTFKFAVGAVVIGYTTYHRRSWARWLALCCNAMGIVYCSVFAYLFAGTNQAAFAAALLNVALLAAATYLLSLRSTAKHFRSENTQEQSSIVAPDQPATEAAGQANNSRSKKRGEGKRAKRRRR